MIYRVKRITIICMGFILAGIFFMQAENRKEVKCKFVEDEEHHLMIQVFLNDRKENIYLTDTGENGTYFILPSYVTTNTLDMSEFNGDFFDVDGEWSDVETYKWQENRTCTVVSSNGEVYEVKFAKSGKLPTLFVNTQSGSLDYLRQDKNNEENGVFSIVNPDGKYEKVDEELLRVTGRGNTTFKAPQMSLGFTMKHGDSICGLGYGKKWNLVSLYFSPDLLKTKIVYDMAQEVGMDFQSDSTWVDLYCNGTYMGVYLLTEPIDVSMTRINIFDLEDKNKKINIDKDIKKTEYIVTEKSAYYDIVSPDDITGGYVIEMTPQGRIQNGECFFGLDASHYFFTVKYPSEVSLSEIEYLKSFVQTIDDKIAGGETDYWKYIDRDSFAKQLLIDLIACEQDAMWDSSFYYKDAGKDVLYAGPLWDYDRSFGITQDRIDYTQPIENCVWNMSRWYMSFYEDEEFRETLVNYYMMLIPYIKELVDTRIDDYVVELSEAQEMTELLLGENKGDYYNYSYKQYSNTIRYLKYYLVNRCNYLTSEWGLDATYLLELPENYDIYHTVTFINEENNVINEIQVKDGEGIINLPQYEEELYQGWRMQSPYLIYNSMLPIYEDTQMFLEKR